VATILVLVFELVAESVSRKVVKFYNIVFFLLLEILIVFAGSTLHLNVVAYCATYVILDAEVSQTFNLQSLDVFFLTYILFYVCNFCVVEFLHVFDF